MTTFVGNVIDMGISGTQVIHEPAMEFFFYALLMLIVISVFIAISMNYTYVDEHPLDADDEDDNDVHPNGGNKRTSLNVHRDEMLGSSGNKTSSDGDLIQRRVPSKSDSNEPNIHATLKEKEKDSEF